MGKRPRLKGAELYHHIFNRGNNRHPLFKDDSDYERYLGALFRFAEKFEIKVIAYALMEWHIHLFIYDSLGKISQFMNVLHGWYAQIFNKLYRQIGHVFEGRFKNKIVDANNYGVWLSRYLHLQPVDAGIVLDPKDYNWTSYRTYIGLDDNSYLYTGIILEQFDGDKATQYVTYKQFIVGSDDAAVDYAKVEQSAQSIIGDDKFIEEIKTKLGQKNEHKIENPIRFISSYLKMPSDILLNPRNKREKSLRRKAITILGNKYGLGIREIARLFCVAPSSVCAVIKSSKYKDNED